MSHERTARLSASPPLFKSRFLDFFSRIHPSVPALIYVPVIAALVVLGARDGLGALEIVLLVFAGFLVGYLMYDYTHYYLHHFVPRSKLGKHLREQHMRPHFQDHRYGFGV